MKRNLLLFAAMLIVVQSQGQIFEFAKTIASNNVFYHPFATAIDNSGNSYSVWSYDVSAGAIDMDPGAGIFMSNPVTTFGRNLFILKLDVLGNFVWAKEIKGTLVNSSGRANSIGLDSSGNIYFTGYLKGTVDFDPGAASFTLTAVSVEDFFVCKLDSTGGLVWANSFITQAQNMTSQIVVDSTDNLIISGCFLNSVDFDPGIGVYNLYASPSTMSTFLLKLDSNGAFIWARKTGLSGANVPNSLSFDKYGNIYTAGAGDKLIKYSSLGDSLWSLPNMGYIYSLDVDSLGNVIVVGHYGSPVDFDPGTGVSLHTPVGIDIFIQKFSPSGMLFWTKFIGGANDQIAKSVVVDSYNNIFLTGISDDSIDLDPGAGIFMSTATSPVWTFVLKIDAEGNFKWGFQIEGGNPKSTFITADNNDNIYLIGYFEYVAAGTDFDPSASNYVLNCTGSGRGFFAKYSQNVCSNIAIVVDSVSNVKCGTLGFGSGHAIDGLAPYTYQWNTIPITNDSIASFISSSIYQLTVTDANSCVKTTSILVNAPLYFSGEDLNANLTSTNYRVGVASKIFLDGFNDGCVPTSGSLQLILDTLVIYTSAVPAPDLINGDTLLWNFNDLIYDSVHVMPQIIVQTPTWATIGDTVCFKTIISPLVGDIDTTNNIKQYCFPVLNGYDPNDKKVYPIGICTSGYINDDELLTYTVRFQNTGNASAIDVYILDTLDVDLNLNTVRVIGNSHSVITEVLQGNVLKFRFDNINLADSTSNEAASHGYVIFEVLPNTGLSNGTTITNKVGIYFDFNPPIFTNTVLNTISDGTVNTNVSAIGNTISASLAGASYQWLNCDNSNSVIAGATNQSYTAMTSGNYSVIINDGCFVDTSACVSVFVTGISEVENSNQFSFYPNPSNNTITITTIEPTQIKIINMLGEVVIEKQVQNNTVIDINNLSNGIYFIQTKDGYSTKLIKN